MRSGAVLGAVANRATNAFGDNGAEERAIRAANEAVAILDEWARLKTAAGKTNFFPSLLRGLIAGGRRSLDSIPISRSPEGADSDVR